MVTTLLPHMQRCIYSPTSYLTPFNQRVWLGSKGRTDQYQSDIHIPTAPDGFLENINLTLTQCSTNVVVVSSRIEVHWFYLFCDCTNSSDLSADENELSDDDSLLFELHNDDSGFDGIFEPQQ